MFAIIGALISGVSSIFGAATGGVGRVLTSLATGLGICASTSAWLSVFLVTDGKVRDAAITLGKDIIGAVI